MTKVLADKYLPGLAFLLLFAAEFTYYLLILQTGIVSYHHSVLTEIWMVPVGGMLGIVLSVFLHKERRWLIPFLLFVQLLLSVDYAEANGFELFLLGLVSGITAPMLIARIERFWLVVLSLALSYAFGTYVFDVPAIQRTEIALFLSAVALFASLFSHMQRERKKTAQISLYSMGSVFLWLLLDAALFETLSRDSVMQLWGEGTFTWNIIVSHIVGLAVAYRSRNYRHNDAVLLLLFMLTYGLYTAGSQSLLSLVYPFVISYYNVIILKKLFSLPYATLAFVSLSLWAASGAGLLIALSHTFLLAWIVLFLLILSYGWHQSDRLFALLEMTGFLPLNKSY